MKTNYYSGISWHTVYAVFKKKKEEVRALLKHHNYNHDHEEQLDE